ncbi:MAG TPA: DUF4907 domain-containing protein [Saprospiraceae bacterium]|nr:DUF4907 domain-containing protein [Saprospiraceae bacterium]
MRYTCTLIITVFSVLFLQAEAMHPFGSGVDTIPASIGEQDSSRVLLQAQKKQMASQMAKAAITYFIIRVPDEKFGYTVFIDGQMYIEQKSIPAVQGNAGFKTEEEATIMAQLVIEKIRQGEMPPTISIEELNKHNIVY